MNSTNMIFCILGFVWWVIMGVLTTPFVLVYAAVRLAVILFIAFLQLPLRSYVFILIVVIVLNQLHKF